MTTDPVTLFAAFVIICFAVWLLIVWAIAGCARPTVGRGLRQRISK